MKEAAGNLEFEEAGRMRDEIKRLQSVALAVGDDPMARQMDIEATAGSYAGERPFGRAANLPSTRPRKPTDADMGPHNWGGGEARPKGGEDEGQAAGVSRFPAGCGQESQALVEVEDLGLFACSNDQSINVGERSVPATSAARK